MKHIDINSILIVFLTIYMPHSALAANSDTIDFARAVINDPVNGNFWSRLNLSGISLDKGIPTFNSPATFERAHFDNSVDLGYAVFDSLADFQFAEFNSTAIFWDSRFWSEANFRRSAFLLGPQFAQAKFDSTALFNQARFRGEVNFVSADFRKAAKFYAAEFDSTVYFKWASFGTKADFHEAIFKGVASFQGAILPDSLDLRNVITTYPLDFASCELRDSTRRCLVAVYGIDIPKIRLRMGLFKLWFPQDTIYRYKPQYWTISIESIIQPNISGSTIRPIDSQLFARMPIADTISHIERIDSISDDEKNCIYQSVLKGFADAGLKESYQILDIDYQKWQCRHRIIGGNWLQKRYWSLLDKLQQVWWNYGYNKEYIFLWSFGLWFAYSLINVGLYRKLSDMVYSIDFLDRIAGSRYYIKSLPLRIILGLRRLAVYIMQVGVYTAIIFFGIRMDLAKFRQGAVRKHPFLFGYLMFVFASGLICLGFMVNIIFTK